MSTIKNMVLTVLLQCISLWNLFSIILTPQLFFWGIAQYFATLIEDANEMIQKFSPKSTNLLEEITKLIIFHDRSLQ